MMRHRALILIACFFSLTMPRVSGGEIDTRRISLSSQFADPVAWLNVEGTPFWAGGIKPRYSFKDRSHFVELAPGEDVRLIVPRGEGVLVQSDSEGLMSLDWSTSNGSGLWIRAATVVTENEGQVLLPFSIRGTRLVAIRHPAVSEGPIRIALFISRRDAGTRIRFERQSIALNTNRRTLLLGLQHQAGPLYELKPGEVISVEVEGPHRYLLEHRVFYPLEVSDRRFNYRVELRAGDRESESEFVAFPQVRDFSTISGRTRVVGRLMRSYIDVAPGRQRLTIRTDAPLLARLLGPFDEHRAEWAQDAEATVEGSAWLSDQATIEADAISDPRSNAHQRALLRIARDNRRIDSGLLATERAIAEASAMPNLRSLRRFAQTLLIGQIGYRGLLARRSHSAGLEESRSYLFITSRLRSPFDDRDRYVLGDQHVTSLRRQTLAGRFVPLPPANRELVFFLPKRPASSRLRLALQPRGEEGDACRLTVTLGNGEGEKSRIELRSGPTPDPNLIDVGASEVATSLQTARGDIPGDVASLGWSSETSNAEFDLPMSADVVRIRSTDCEGRRIALAYGAGRKDSMNEAEYRAAESTLGGPPATARLFSAALANLDELLDGEGILPAAVGDAAGKEAWERAASARLLNHWIPSLRLLRARDIAYRHHVEAIEFDSVRVSTDDELLQLLTKAEDLERDGHWLAAYEVWMRIAEGGASESAARAKRRAAEALVQLGESRLAARILKSEAIHARDEADRMQAFTRLVEVYHRQGNDVGLEGLLASRAIHSVGNAQGEALARFADLALEQGKASLALSLDLVLPAVHFDPSRRAEAAYLRGWWLAFEESLATLDPAAANRWRGYRAQQAGDFDEARDYWREADDAGKSALAALDRALEIRRELVDGSSEERQQALQQWAAWRNQLPGRRIWKSAESLVIAEDGGELLRSRSLGQFSRWARSTPERPLRIRVVGPTRLRIDTRPLLTPDSPRTEPSWLVFRTDLRHWRSAIAGALVSPGLERSAEGPEQIGTRSRSTLSLGPGIHEIEIFDPRGATLVRIFEEHAQLDFAMLPKLGPSALDWLEGTAPPPAASTIGCRSFGQLNICSRPLFELPKIGVSTTPLTDLKVSFDPDLFENGERDNIASAWPQFSPAAELPPAEAEIDREFRPALDPDEMVRDTWLITERNRQPYGRMTRVGARADLSRDDPLVQRLYTRALSNFRWKRVTKVVASAGVRRIPQPLGAPLTPRARQSWPLLSPSCRRSDRIRASGELEIRLKNPGPTSLTIEIENCHRASGTPRPASVLIDVDGNDAAEVRLDANTRTHRYPLRVASGSHSIRIRAGVVPRGQSIGIRVLENGLAINQVRSRAYHIAKPESPLILDISGPTRIRIDQLHAGVTRTSYRSLPRGTSRIELTSDGNPEMLYRVTKTVRKDAVAIVREPVPPRAGPVHSRLTIAALAEDNPEPEEMNPGQIEAGREDGTWTLTAKYISRSVDDDDPSSNVSEEMGELRGTHRFRNQSWGFYSQTDLFARPRENGGPTFGGRANWIWPSLGIWRGIERRVTLTTVFQPPTDGPNELEALLGGRFEAALPHALTAKLQHRPSIVVFARWLSLSDRNGYPRENLDRDVFTPYKADHLFGLRLKDSLAFRPYRDVFTKFDIAVNTNEDFDPTSPDRLSMRWTAAALYEGLEIDGGYQWRRYFADEDRKDDSDLHDLFFGLQIERWMHTARRWQFGVEVRHELSRSTTSMMLSLSIHLGRERGFRDFAPGTVRFRSERDLTRRRQTHWSRGRRD